MTRTLNASALGVHDMVDLMLRAESDARKDGKYIHWGYGAHELTFECIPDRGRLVRLSLPAGKWVIKSHPLEHVFNLSRTTEVCLMSNGTALIQL